MLSAIEARELKDMVQRVLHAPGNDIRSTPEMAVVFDTCLEKEDAAAYGKQIAEILKSMGDTFCNVRLNLVWWGAQEGIRHEISAFVHLMTQKAFREYESRREEKRLEELFRELKMYQARSRLILLIAANPCRWEDDKALMANLNPFLHRRLILIFPDGIRHGSSLITAGKE